jgi:CheY-like chemotaxis protein
MRKSVENSKTAIIAVTAFSRDEIEEKCYSSGINDVITKPIFIDELRNVLESWTDLS